MSKRRAVNQDDIKEQKYFSISEQEALNLMEFLDSKRKTNDEMRNLLNKLQEYFAHESTPKEETPFDILALPPDTIKLILSYLTSGELACFSNCSSQCFELVNKEEPWKDLVLLDFSEDVEDDQEPSLNSSSLTPEPMKT